MKKWEKRYNSIQWIKIARKRFLRSHRCDFYSSSLVQHKKRANSIIEVTAPERIDLYSHRFYSKTFEFIDQLIREIRNNSNGEKTIHVNFMHTNCITAAAGILLLSKLKTTFDHNSKPRIKLTRPKETQTKTRNSTIFNPQIADSALNRIGIYEILGYTRYELKEVQNVKCWDVITGSLVDATAVGKMLQTVALNIKEKQLQVLFRPLIEAVSNSVEHAYNAELISSSKIPVEDKWWCFTSRLMNKLTVIICDLGVGIPNTLRKTQDANMLEALRNFVGGVFRNDADYIHAAMNVKKTRTRLHYRGKGTGDLKSAIEKINNSTLVVFSNKGKYTYKNKNGHFTEKTETNPTSIGGTIVEWTVPLSIGDINA